MLEVMNALISDVIGIADRNPEKEVMVLAWLMITHAMQSVGDISIGFQSNMMEFNNLINHGPNLQPIRNPMMVRGQIAKNVR